MTDNIERRRELLERLANVLDEMAESWDWARRVQNIVIGALEIGDLGDDGAWLALLEMALEEVADDGANE